MNTLQSYLADHCRPVLNTAINAIQPVSGGDINQAFRLITSSGKDFFVKYQRSPQAVDMLRTEANALSVLAKAGIIRIPEIVTWTALGQGDAMLLMEFIPAGKASSRQMHAFGRQLASLHQNTASRYGWQEDNFIGTLPQRNAAQTTAAAFLQSQRLLPQWEMATTQGFFTKKEERAFSALLDTLPELIPEERPALIHGDLWSGNYLTTPNGEAVLIDPASSYGLREMDIAMSRLFGHFGESFYDGYQAVWPLPPGYATREHIYQLYYLLVHVNLFGQSYVASVRDILQPYAAP